MNKDTLFFRKLALFGYFGLLIWMPVWYILLSDNEFTSNFVIAALIVPLLFPMKGLLQANPYTHAWTNFVVMIYFMHSLTSLLTAPDEIVYALIELFFATSLFIGCSYFARLRGRELGMKLQKLSEITKQEKALFEEEQQEK